MGAVPSYDDSILMNLWKVAFFKDIWEPFVKLLKLGAVFQKHRDVRCV
jgi:hypothetical protein